MITSLTRPADSQPRNASSRSVHPTGMALDIRRHNTPACRQWLDRVLLSLEKSKVLEATLEKRPPHYHIAVFPLEYADYVATIDGTATVASDSTAAGGGFRDLLSYTVRRKDTLWRIAQAHGTTPEVIRAANGLRGSTIRVGQILQVPVASDPR